MIKEEGSREAEESEGGIRGGKERERERGGRREGRRDEERKREGEREGGGGMEGEESLLMLLEGGKVDEEICWLPTVYVIIFCHSFFSLLPQGPPCPVE